MFVILLYGGNICFNKNKQINQNYTGKRPDIGGGYVDYHILFLGFSSEESMIYEIGGTGKICVIRTDCGSLGPGLFAGTGATVPLGISMSDIEASLAGDSIGLSSDIGASGYGFGVGISEDGITSLGSAKGMGRLGAGCGASLTIDFCKSTILWCNKP